jgi:hypothetical protein
MRLKAMEEASGSSVVVWVDLEPGVNKGPYEPGPDSALVIGCVAGAQVTVVACLVLGMVRRQRPQAHRREQALLDDLEHWLPARWREDGMAQGDGQELIGPAGGVVTLLAVDDIVQVPAGSVPEAVIEGPVGQRGVLGQPPRCRLILFGAYPAFQ